MQINDKLLLGYDRVDSIKNHDKFYINSKTPSKNMFK